MAGQAALEKKAEDVELLDVHGLCSFTDGFLLATGTNQKQIVAIVDSITDTLKTEGRRPHHIEGYPQHEWILLDYGDFVAHIFTQRLRAFYGLERLWGEARKLDLA
jgi:ribosome-associated protein